MDLMNVFIVAIVASVTAAICHRDISWQCSHCRMQTYYIKHVLMIKMHIYHTLDTF